MFCTFCHYKTNCISCCLPLPYFSVVWIRILKHVCNIEKNICIHKCKSTANKLYRVTYGEVKQLVGVWVVCIFLSYTVWFSWVPFSVLTRYSSQTIAYISKRRIPITFRVFTNISIIGTSLWFHKSTSVELTKFVYPDSFCMASRLCSSKTILNIVYFLLACWNLVLITLLWEIDTSGNGDRMREMVQE